jgi:ankyrin repeat protein
MLIVFHSGGADVNAKNVIGRTPIYVTMASEWESLTKKSDSDRLSARIATMLIDAGASVNDADTFGKHVGETALFRAARLCRHESMKLLISAGADVKVLNLSSGDTVFHVYRKDAHCCMQQLIDAGGIQVINSANALDGDTPLHVAVKRSVTGQSVELLLKARADPTIANHSGYVPLHEACRYGRIRSIEKLLAFGVDIDVPSNKKSVQKQGAMFQPTSSGTKPRQQLSDVDFKELDFKELAVALCFAQSKLQDHTPFSDTPLHMACRNGQNESVCLLLQHHILPNVLAKNSGGDVPLDASRNLDARTTRLLLEAMSRHSSSIQSIFLSNTGGKQEDYALFEDNLTFIFDHFPKLMQLTIDNCDGLRSVPPGIKMLTCLVNIDLINCSYLRSLPDEMGHMAKLLEINVKTCPALEFPPIKICKGSKATQKIQAYLMESAGATPLRSVKVLFLGNGRSGKTSVLRMLAKKPLQPGDAGPESTRGVSGVPPGLVFAVLH